MKKLYFKNFEEEVELEDLSELNKILNANLINQNNDFDFQILLDDGLFNIKCSVIASQHIQ